MLIVGEVSYKIHHHMLKISDVKMESENIYHNLKHKNDSRSFNRDLSREDISTNKDTADIQKSFMSFIQNGAVNNRKSRWFVMITACLGLICVLLLVAIIVQHNKISTDRDLMMKSYINITEEYNKTLSSLKVNYTHLIDERDQLQSNLSSMSQKKLELETELKKRNSQKGWYYISSQQKNWYDSRQFCRNRGGDLVIINTEDEQRVLTAVVKENTWIGLSDIENEGVMKWVDNTPLNTGFWMPGEPNNSGDEDCIEIVPSSQPGNNWNDQHCSSERKWICEN